MMAINRPWSTNLTRRKKEDMAGLRSGLYQLLEERHPQTVRQVFYQAVSVGLVEKTEADYKGVIVRLCGEMREGGELPWEWLADSTRWMHKPNSYDSLEGALRWTAETYRRALWNEQPDYLEIWCEKEALSMILYGVTSEYDVPLMIVRGFPSKDFVHSAAVAIEQRGKPAYIYYFGDHDPSGLKIWDDIQVKIARYAPEAEVYFMKMAVTEFQIQTYGLPTRPTKREGNPHARDFEGESVEVDALPVDVLEHLVRASIGAHIDFRQLEITRLAEESEREVLRSLRMPGAKRKKTDKGGAA